MTNSTPNSSLPERRHLRIGYLPLTDCAPLVAAVYLNIGERHGLTLELRQQPSWAAIRDKLLSGELDAAQTLYGMVYGVQQGLGGPQADMAILMTLNKNGQAITVSNRLAQLLQQHDSLTAAFAQLGRKPLFAQTFPTGTHAMWLNYWLASQDVHPLHDIDNVVLPPPLMAEALAHGELDGFCAGEPWNAVAENKQCGRTLISTSQIWPDHPEKALACRLEFATLYPNTALALIRTILEACQWLENPTNKIIASGWLAQTEFLNLPQQIIASRMHIAATTASSELALRFFDDAAMNAPKPSDGLWFLSQFHRWGLLKSTDNWDGIVAKVCQTAHYAQAASSLGMAAQPPAPAPVQFIDAQRWDGVHAIDYARSFAIKA